ncbi:hypothetical protein Cgig2_024166 [Carnegiea gigantea]|uniref:Uncharacterized protein n=1 Tax=Carnegiea gigantea TaxID=171969 RepID=A0A9Q1K9V2_9CARY|nr:hypothetical protein Cgig2_024166 [Carnegiea gigantea]
MQGEKKKKTNQPWKSLYLSFRRHLPCSCSFSSSSSNDDENLPINPAPLPKNPQFLANTQHNVRRSSSRLFPNETARMHWQRVLELEKELAELDKWLHTELARLRSHFEVGFYQINDQGALCANKNSGVDDGLERLEANEGYLYHLHQGMMLINGTCQDLHVQFSPPIPLPPDQFGSNIFEILNQMEKMEGEDLVTWLLETSLVTNTSNITANPFGRAPQDLEEAILENAVSKLGQLVIQGLQIQLDFKDQAEKRPQWRSNTDVDDNSRRGNGGSIMITAMLIKPKDLQNGHLIVDDKEVMVGFVEVEDDEENRVVIKGVHVVGFRDRRSGRGHVRHSCTWWVSFMSS